jgi:phosphoglycerol transferase MdoB-like AlkP superfamily enzyme
MNPQTAIPGLAAGSDASPAATLHGRWLLLARAAWVAVVVLTLVLFVAGIPGVFADLQTSCSGPNCLRPQLSSEYAQALEGLGLSLGFYAAYKIALEACLVLGFCVVAVLLFWRRSSERMALFGAVMLVAFGGATFNDTILSLGTHTPALWWLGLFVRLLLPLPRWPVYPTLDALGRARVDRV